MFYRDLSCYRDGDGEEIVDVFPSVKNIGWLGVESEYSKGIVREDLIQKLREITFLDLKNDEDIKTGNYEKEKSINVHCMHVRGSPYSCPFSQASIEYNPSGLGLYKGNSTMKAGVNEICIPSLKSGEFYSFPTLLLHYITEHGYCPPQGFLDALDAFDLSVPYDIDSKQGDLEIVEVDRTDMDKYN
ncbi:hypothetical protein [Pseudoteredinibacter isoporae]|uniref:DUF7919 domain-containing protein n=1 Tax=Pseudoteredinibacter isoporae TaxID=570281 RepID=A0A7X0MVX6_9GAMM|nr:hypothetical protein [Pseudoteredinibacter isoporae]MBB6521853.1 hypothetical protein [Pseudoteredinibacter isoporae]NHO87397.1 hypothetical protein [Pseudoteredinibacter isoporae]NIB22512.1 hypothetical protein [Pseudoteredinibacter isoporae]